MKVKKLIVINLVMAGLLLTACGKDTDKKEVADTPIVESTEVEEKEESTQEEKAEEVTEEALENPESEENEEVKLLQLDKDIKNVTYADSETYESYMKYKDEKIILSKEEAVNYPALASTLEKELNKRNNSYQAEMDSLIESYKEDKEYGYAVGYETSGKMNIERADSVVLSIRELASEYTGGAHGMYGSFGYNYDVQTGQVLKFSDVVSDPVAFLKLANDKIQEPFSGDCETPASLDDYYEDYDTSIIWTVDYQGVKIYFNPYTLGSYALGMIETKIYFNEAPELFNPKYLNIPESYVIGLDMNENSLIDINNDGQNDNISITTKYDDEYSYIVGAKLEVDGKTFDFDREVDNCYYVYNKGKNYILAFTAYEGEYKCIATIDLSTMSMDSNKDVPGYLAVYSYDWSDADERSEYNSTEAVFTDPNKVLLSTYIQYLGTMSGMGYYHMGDEGYLVSDTGVYTIDMDYVITANIDVDCEKVDLDGNVTGKAVIPEGTRLVVRRGDGETFADMIEVPADADVETYDDYGYYEYLNSDLEMKDADIIYRVHGELNEYGSMAVINGQEEYKVFDKILYAD